MARRWNGWGDDSIDFTLGDTARSFLEERIGRSQPPTDARLEDVCAKVRKSRLPPHHLITFDPEIRLRNGFGQSLPDWLSLRYGQVRELPDGVAFPECNEDVREVIEYAKSCDAVIIPCGGNTSVVGHLTACDLGRAVITVNMSRMSRLLDFDPQSHLATFGAGVAGPNLESALRAHGFTLGHFPQSFDYSTLGGWIAARSAGQQSLRYGRIEQLFAGGRLETPMGTLKIRSFPGSAAGLDLRALALGSEGRMGIVTEATVRICPLPQKEAFFAIFFTNWSHGANAVKEMAQERLPLSMLRLANAQETKTTFALSRHSSVWLKRYLAWRGCKDDTCMLLVGISGSPSAFHFARREAFGIAKKYGGLLCGQTLGKRWRENRFKGVYLRNAAWQSGYAIDTVETATDWPCVTPMMNAIEHAATEALAKEGERLHCYTHLSHIYPQGASVYTTFFFRSSGDFSVDMTRWKSLKHAASEAIVRLGGTISHQHGVGIDHEPFLKVEKGELGMQALRQICQIFDPSEMLNPGKLVGTRTCGTTTGENRSQNFSTTNGTSSSLAEV